MLRESYKEDVIFLNINNITIRNKKEITENKMDRSAHQRREILRSNLEYVQSLCESVDEEHTLKKLEEIIEQNDEVIMQTSIEEKAANQEEIVLDSEIMSASSKVIDQCVNSLTENLDCSYNPSEFAEKLIKYVKQFPDEEQEELDWSLLETGISKCFRSIPTYSTLSGTITSTIKKVRERKQIVKEAQAPIKRPGDVVITSKMENNVEETVLKIHRLISNYYKSNSEPLSYFRLMINPTDYGKTIENMLHVACLVRDGTIRITKDNSNGLVVKLRNDGKSTKKENIQHDMYLRMDMWKTLREKYKVTKPLI